MTRHEDIFITSIDMLNLLCRHSAARRSLPWTSSPSSSIFSHRGHIILALHRVRMNTERAGDKKRHDHNPRPYMALQDQEPQHPKTANFSFKGTVTQEGDDAMHRKLYLTARCSEHATWWSITVQNLSGAPTSAALVNGDEHITHRTTTTAAAAQCIKFRARLWTTVIRNL